MELVIKKHGVKQNENNLSFMQDSVLNSYHRNGDNNLPVIIVSAPTGSGKSYVFEKAVIEKKENIIFISPTIELAKNLQKSFEQTLREKNYSEEIIKKRVLVYNSSTLDEEKNFYKNSEDRTKTLYNVPYIEEKNKNDIGTIIFITPETLFNLIVNRLNFNNYGRPYNLLSFLGSAIWNRIVVDESHLMTPKIIGLLYNLISICCNNENENFKNYTQFVLLSATQINYKKALVDCGLNENNIHYIDEKIIEDDCDRWIHGNVKIKFIKSTDFNGDIYDYVIDKLPDLLDKKTMVICDKVKKQLVVNDEFEKIMLENGYKEEDFIFINSQTHQKNKLKNKEIDNQKIVIGTSAIEQGLTLKGLNYMIIEPGFEAMNFVQRIGRVSRGNLDGEVVVFYDENHLQRNWFRKILNYVEKNETVSILDFVKTILSDEGTKTNEDGRLFFERRLDSVKICSGLMSYYFNQLYVNCKYKDKNNMKLLYSILTKNDKWVYSMMEKLKSNIKTRDLAFCILKEAVNFRDFKETWNVISEGNTYSFQKDFCMKNTTLIKYPQKIENNVIYINIGDRKIKDIMLPENEYGQYFETLIGYNGEIFENRIIEKMMLSNYIEAFNKQIFKQTSLQKKKETEEICKIVKNIILGGKILPIYNKDKLEGVDENENSLFF